MRFSIKILLYGNRSEYVFSETPIKIPFSAACTFILVNEDSPVGIRVPAKILTKG